MTLGLGCYRNGNQVIFMGNTTDRSCIKKAAKIKQLTNYLVSNSTIITELIYSKKYLLWLSKTN